MWQALQTELSGTNFQVVSVAFESRGIEAALEKFASENRLPRAYADEFFPPSRSSRKEEEPEPTPK